MTVSRVKSQKASSSFVVNVHFPTKSFTSSKSLVQTCVGELATKLENKQSFGDLNPNFAILVCVLLVLQSLHLNFAIQALKGILFEYVDKLNILFQLNALLFNVASGSSLIEHLLHVILSNLKYSHQLIGVLHFYVF